MWISNKRKVLDVICNPTAIKNVLVIIELCLNDHSIDQIIEKNPHFIDFLLKFFPNYYQNTLQNRKKDLKITLMNALLTFRHIESTGQITPKMLKTIPKYLKLLAKIC